MLPNKPFDLTADRATGGSEARGRRTPAPMNGPMPPKVGKEGRAPATPTRNDEPLQSGVLSSPAEPMLSRAITQALSAPAVNRAQVFSHLVREIEHFMEAHPQERPWTCTVHTGTDGSTIFRGGIGHSLVVDPAGRLWRARSYEDFDTTYRFVDRSCEIDTLTPRYEQMREYRSR
jgi:hypothetical protein